ncbi:hypothetical protein FXO38_04231 [Capsicum annuum]|nr:hypothetical protein FXO38_04231 [Capsicum annuum]
MINVTDVGNNGKVNCEAVNQVDNLGEKQEGVKADNRGKVQTNAWNTKVPGPNAFAISHALVSKLRAEETLKETVIDIVVPKITIKQGLPVVVLNPIDWKVKVATRSDQVEVEQTQYQHVASTRNVLNRTSELGNVKNIEDDYRVIHSEDKLDENTLPRIEEKEDENTDQIIRAVDSTFDKHMQEEIQKISGKQGLSLRGHKKKLIKSKQTSTSKSAGIDKIKIRSQSRSLDD